MQFHLDGFRTGDPRVKPAAPNLPEGIPDQVDVLIVGCGPAGLTLAAQLSAFAGISTMIVDQKPGPLELGQADGIACRTMEMFQAFGFAEKLMQEAYWVNETTFWKPDDDQPRHIARSGRIQDVEDDLSEFPHLILNQARVHDFYLEVMRNSPRRLEPLYNRQLTDLSRDDSAEYPITARFDTPDGEQVVQARYAVGCDGARSTVRKSIGRQLTGDAANQAWGVMDVLAVSDFPDLRFKSVIRSASEGNILIIPREGGYLVRLYVEMDKLAADERVASRNITSDQLVSAAQRILHPYTLDVKEIAWWSVYEIGQRLCDKFDDSTGPAQTPRIFIAGDACHTHSPKAGQGMNVSMGDTFNLGWKLAAVLRGQADPDLLHSYSAERQGVAADLIDFDRHWAKRFSEEAGGDQAEGTDAALDAAAFQDYFAKHGRYTAGTAVQYAPSALVMEDRHQALATGQVIGKRFHSAQVIRLADGKPMQLGHAALADGRWRLYAFAGSQDPRDTDSPLWQLCEALATDPALPLLRYTPEAADIDAMIDLRAVIGQSHHDVNIDDLHPLLKPAKGRYGLPDTEKVFTPDRKSGMDIYDMRGIDPEEGCLLIVRPDQYVAGILPLTDTAALAAFFDGVLRRTE
ncbi:FAD-binding monooxygenase [Pseudooceanicola atlanticus]|uniref:Phenol 2-monooxygenase n=1 Tax=Pseudooceanicola atlanticus TaxID=1461694 RepID=A0A0A0EE19_9RHOB|nr:FAD-binding monooxygenase [Pseudooceanicola atlanticus]KGM49216.1 phenol 2-monooxygenase [Pseudooceanicola atlanticus]